MNLLTWSRRATWWAIIVGCASFWLGVFGLVLIAIAEWAR